MPKSSWSVPLQTVAEASAEKRQAQFAMCLFEIWTSSNSIEMQPIFGPFFA
jgi:hypothetical protein